jgi:hypothetical protein
MEVKESTIVHQIRSALWVRSIPNWKIHGSASQSAGLPDIIGVFKGRFFGIEVKRPGEVPSKIQAHKLKTISDAGGIAGVATSAEEALALLEGVGGVSNVQGNNSKEFMRLALTGRHYWSIQTEEFFGDPKCIDDFIHPVVRKETDNGHIYTLMSERNEEQWFIVMPDGELRRCVPVPY